MKPSVRALLSNLIDYAGLFPPAKLPMDEALNTYLHEKNDSPHRWMLSRFVCPVSRLQDLLGLAKSHPDANLLNVAALFPQSATVANYYPDLDQGVASIEMFHRALGNDQVIDVVEIPLPNDMKRLTAPTGADPTLWHTRMTDFLEIPVGSTWHHGWKNLLAEFHLEHRGPPKRFKLRCGGLTRDAFPSDRHVAYFIAQCRANRSIWKATAGLHHPRRFWDESLQVWHHGFLNIFGAGALAWSNDLTTADIAKILADRDAAHFRFDEEGLAWKNWHCTTEQIVDARANFATSFGCCSFDEPCADLMAMGLLE